jgi:hypothetical protein
MRRLAWVESDQDGIIQWIASGAGYRVELYLAGWIEGSAGVGTSFLGAPFPPDYQIPLSITDDVGVILASIYVWAITPDGETEYAVIEGSDWNPPWDGTITPNAENGYDILIETIGTDVIGAEGRLYVVGDWTIIVEADLVGGGSIRSELIIPINTDVPTLQVSDRSQLEVVTPDDTRTMRFRITDLWGFDQDTLGLTVAPKVAKTTNLNPGEQGTEVTIIDGGVIKSPFNGTIRANGDFLGYDVTVRGLPDFYDPCTWDFTWTGESIVEKEFSEENLI